MLRDVASGHLLLPIQSRDSFQSRPRVPSERPQSFRRNLAAGSNKERKKKGSLFYPFLSPPQLTKRTTSDVISASKSRKDVMSLSFALSTMSPTFMTALEGVPGIVRRTRKTFRLDGFAAWSFWTHSSFNPRSRASEMFLGADSKSMDRRLGTLPACNGSRTGRIVLMSMPAKNSVLRELRSWYEKLLQSAWTLPSYRPATLVKTTWGQHKPCLRGHRRHKRPGCRLRQCPHSWRGIVEAMPRSQTFRAQTSQLLLSRLFFKKKKIKQ